MACPVTRATQYKPTVTQPKNQPGKAVKENVENAEGNLKAVLR